jgi:hypothetical protein
MAFSLKAVFGIDATGFRTELRQLRRELNTFATDAMKLGTGVAVGAFVALSKGALDLAAGLKDTALQVGINVEALQALHYAATQNGSSVGSMNKALEKLRLNTQAAAEGNKQQAEAFATLGINVADFLRLPLEKRYEAIGKAVQNSRDKQAAFNAVSEIFGAKIGPDQIAVLNSLATQGFPATAKAAAEAGQVMKAETVAALEGAAQAIDDFKKRATIAVGNILVNFRSEEGLKLMLYQLLKAAGVFGAKILDTIAEASGFVRAVLGASFGWVIDKFRDGWLDSVARIASALNRILPDGMQINVAGIEALKSAGQSVADRITAAIAETKPSTFAKDVGEFWDGVIKDQQGVVDQMNKVDFGKPAAQLKDAGNELQNSGEQAATKITDAVDRMITVTNGASSITLNLRDAARLIYDASGRFVGVVSKVGQAFAPLWGIEGVLTNKYYGDLSNEGLSELIRQSKNKANELRNPALTRSNIGTDIEASRLEASVLNAQRELDIRNDFQSQVGRLGVAGARSNYDPIVFEELLRRFGPNSDTSEQTQLLREIADQRRDFQAIAEGLKTVRG